VRLDLDATATANDAEAVRSADSDFSAVRRVRFVELGSPAFERLLPE
jgi:hypothetical protein